MLLSEIVLQDWHIVVLSLALALIVTGVTFILYARSVKRKQEAQEAQKTQADRVIVKDGVRYDLNNATTGADGTAKVTFTEKDFTLSRGTAYRAQKGGKLLPGKYTVLSTSGDTAVSIRLGGFVREYKHGEGIVIADGDEITAVSHTVLLR